MLKKPRKRQARTPEPAMDRPTGARQVLRRPAAAHLHDRDFVALLHQPVRGDAAAESGADDDEVEIALLALARHGGALGCRGHKWTECDDVSTAQYRTGGRAFIAMCWENSARFPNWNCNWNLSNLSDKWPCIRAQPSAVPQFGQNSLGFKPTAQKEPMPPLRGSDSFLTLPTVETVGYHLSRPGRWFVRHLSPAGRKIRSLRSD